jgi:acetyl esterase/lipase
VYATRGERELQIHLHFPPDWKAGDSRASVIFFFGGGWKKGTPNQFLPQAEYFASRGVVTARADYRIKNKDGVSPDECVRDARSAVRWMKKNADRLGIDPGKLVASGGSAGGHLAACMMITDCVEAPDDDLSISTRPVAMLLYNPGMGGEDPEEFPEFLEKVNNDVEVAKKISPIIHLTEDTPPSILFFGSRDKLLKQTESYWEKSKSLGVRSERFIVEGVGHGFFNNRPWLETTLIASDEFLVSLGLLEGPPDKEFAGTVIPYRER